MKTVLLNLAFSGAFVLLYICAYRVGIGVKRKQKNEKYFEAKINKKGHLMLICKQILRYFPFLGSMIIGFCLCNHVLQQNRFVYYWDFGGYWTNSYTYMQSMFSDSVKTFKLLYQSILFREYNYLLPALLVLPLRVFGYTFPRYVLINYVLFFVPTAIILCGLLRKMMETSGIKILSGSGKTDRPFVILPFLPLFFPVFYLAMLQGYIDIACLTPAALSILLMMDYDPLVLDQKQICRDVLISLLLLTTILFRRYFAFFVLGYGMALFALSAYVAAKDYYDKHSRICTGKKTGHLRNHFVYPILNLIVIGAVAGSIMLMLFRPLLRIMIGNSYHAQYAAYDSAIGVKLHTLIRMFGWGVIVLSIIGFLGSVLKKKLRRVSLFCLVSLLTASVTFFSVQNMGVHHILILSIQMMLLAAIGAGFLCFLPKKKNCQRAYKAIVFLFAVLGTANCFFPAIRPVLYNISPLFPQTHNAMQRDDIPALHELADKLNELTEGTDKSVYICASGASLNGSIMMALDKPFANGAVNNQLKTADVDLRDGFPVQFFSADYVVITEPTDLHLPEGTQEVVRYLAQEIEDRSSPVGRHFIRLPNEFPLYRNKTAYIYEKTSAFVEDDYRAIANYYMNLYPNNPELFADRIMAAIG